MGLFKRKAKEKTDQSDSDVLQFRMAELMRHGDEFAAEHGLRHTPQEMERAEQIIEQALARPLTAEGKAALHQAVTGYLYQTIMTNFPDEWAVIEAPDNPVAIAVIKSPTDRVQVLGWQKVEGRIENGAEDNLDFFYRGIAEHAGQPGIQTLM